MAENSAAVAAVAEAWRSSVRRSIAVAAMAPLRFLLMLAFSCELRA
jgi:hypothetical protein